MPWTRMQIDVVNWSVFSRAINVEKNARKRKTNCVFFVFGSYKLNRTIFSNIFSITSRWKKTISIYGILNRHHLIVVFIFVFFFVHFFARLCCLLRSWLLRKRFSFGENINIGNWHHLFASQLLDDGGWQLSFVEMTKPNPVQLSI